MSADLSDYSLLQQEFPADRQVAQLRIPPHSLEAESSVLGGLLLDNSAWDRVSDVLTENDFYRYEHRAVFAAMSALINASKPADVITVYEYLQSLGKAEEVGGLSYLNALAQYVPSTGNIRRYAEIVRDRAILRKLVSTSEEISANAFNPKGRPVASILDEAEQKIFNIGEEGARTKQGFQTMDTLVVDLLDRVQQMADNPNDVTGVPTGFYDLDNLLAGLQDSNLIVMAARPAVGKTAFGLNIARFVAVEKKLPVCVFSLEMSKEELVDRLLVRQAQIDSWKMKTGKLGEDDFSRLSEAMGVLAEAPLYIDDTPALSVLEMRTKARRLQMEVGLRMIVIDYLQLVRGRGIENRVQEVSEISQGLKNLARELRVPVISISQLSRAVEVRGTQRPRLADLRESGSIEQDADVVVFLYREDEENREVVTCEVAKHRNGPVGIFNTVFNPKFISFYNYEEKREK